MADVASTFSSWSPITNNNSPAGTATVGNGADDNFREIQGAIVRGVSHKGSDIASSSTTDLGAVEGKFHDITGTTTINSFGTVRAGIEKVLTFEGALTLTHNATSLILPGGGNILTAVGDVATFYSEGSGNWRCTSYQHATAGFVPAGAIMPFAGATEPAGWLFCYGQAVSRSVYARLFTAISTTYGTGDGVSTFNLPDLRGRVVAGKDNMGGTSANRLTDLTGGLDGDTLGDTGGSETNTITTSNLPASGLSIPSLSVSATGTTYGPGSTPITGRFLAAMDDSSVVGSASVTGSTGTGTTGNMGSGTAINNVQPTIISNFIIKT
jgi:microcystin-dependent protein